ncbi:pyruvate ferredoxin/flavodoxin oxidoreductase [Lucifera butyrica]|uniref:Pyruvate ferredoxin/flavodoxin oxidoreductase n=1 Tax=Lucifera butyrica TaxID=1351585 RepID=A0A498R9M1_9FIRM|nr:2-oxoacid:acceptor oxidoreductase family protein [Lucifera butyrica]VBB07640.1 pyruvate ferredoxin/flavodoxin oxidoreductase [Lucifera butyrica]
MTNEMIMAGFGGQGVMLIGQLMTYAGMLEKKHVSWIPSYGPEMRGGTANCSVIISDEPVGAPIVTAPTTVMAMNLPSLDKFEPMLRPGGILIINSSLIERGAKRSDVKTYQIPSNDIANELGNLKVANMVILGALVAATGAVSHESIMKAFAKMFAKKPELLAINRKAIELGARRVNPQ